MLGNAKTEGARSGLESVTAEVECCGRETGYSDSPVS